MPSFTLGTAAQATGTAKSTILRAIKAGRISAQRDDIGQWQIDPSELFRVFPALALPGATPEQPRAAHNATTDLLVSELQNIIADMRRDRDFWRSAHEREQDAHAETRAAHAATQRLLPAPVAPPVERDATPAGEGATAVETRNRSSWRPWRRAGWA
jgi:hypothetical protein